MIICTNVAVFVFSFLQKTDQMYYTCLQTVFSTLKHEKLDSSGVFLYYERFASVTEHIRNLSEEISVCAKVPW